MGDFFLEPHTVFLNHGSYGACPREVLEAQRQYQLRMERQPVAFMRRFLVEEIEFARQRVARFVGCQSKDLVFVQNATNGVHAVLQNIELQPGDDVLTTSHRYDAVGYALEHWCRQKGAKLITVEIPFPIIDEQDIIQRVQAAITQRTKLLVVDHISSATATLFPAEQLVQVAHQHDCLLLLDGAHVPGQISVNLADLGVDFWTGNLHKWCCAPKGAAVLYVAPQHQKNFHAPVISHGYEQGYQEEFNWMGTADFTAYLATSVALDLHEKWGGQDFRQKNYRLMLEASRLILGAFPAWQVNPPQSTLAMRSFLLPHNNPEDLYTRLLEDYHIEVVCHPWGGDTILRISCFSAYNQLADYRSLVAALRDILG